MSEGLRTEEISNEPDNPPSYESYQNFGYVTSKGYLRNQFIKSIQYLCNLVFNNF